MTESRKGGEAVAVAEALAVAVAVAWNELVAVQVVKLLRVHHG